VLLLHGWSVTADLNWFACYGPLAEHYRVVALDQRGHGRGIRPPLGDVRLSDCADDAAALLEVLNIERAVVVGYSMGGPVAQLLWRRHPERVAGLVLCATARSFQGGPTTNLWYRSYDGLRRLAARTPTLSRRLLERMVGARVTAGPFADWMRGELVRGDPSGLISAMGSLGRFGSETWIGEVDVPAAVVVTTHDQTVPPSRQRALAAAIRGATVHEVDGVHNVVATSPEEFVPIFLDACASVVCRLPA
jgi:3-oxoadipate enol-lactonase